MKTYRITVNGEVYEVMVEEVKGPTSGSVPPRPAAPPPTPVPSAVPPPTSVPQAPPKPAPAPAQTPSAAGSVGQEIHAPMPGKILDIKVAPGDVVKSGTVLIILEAMKMENDIMAPADGTVKLVNVKEGDSVNTGDILLVIE